MSSTADQNPVFAPTWQCVLVCWGDKYGVSLINHLVRQIADHASQLPRFVLITDRPRLGLDAAVKTVDFPAYWLTESFRRSGCQAKLAMFEKGVVPEDLPALYVDLDTIVLGDLSQALRLMETPQTVAILQSAIIPFGPLGRALYRWTHRRKYARGNSSFVLYHPAHCHYIAQTFRELDAQHPNLSFRPMIADERFISWVAQPHMKAIPKSFAVKFPGEYMFYWGWWLYVRALLPWVRRRRRRLAAVTLNGLLVKPEKLLQLAEGDVIVDEKSRKLVWSRHTLGSFQQTIQSYYAHTV